jgi:hypothetical protein
VSNSDDKGFEQQQRMSASLLMFATVLGQGVDSVLINLNTASSTSML